MSNRNNTLNDIERTRLIKQADRLLDKIEVRLHHIFDSIKQKKAKKVDNKHETLELLNILELSFEEAHCIWDEIEVAL